VALLNQNFCCARTNETGGASNEVVGHGSPESRRSKVESRKPGNP
jgi:hypothetical protein